mgnify:FL=1
MDKYFADYETIKYDDIKNWQSRNPLSIVNSVKMPETPGAKTETTT